MGEGGNHLIPRLMILIELYLSLSSRDLYCLRMRAVPLRQPKYDLQMHRAVPRSFVFFSHTGLLAALPHDGLEPGQ